MAHRYTDVFLLSPRRRQCTQSTPQSIAPCPRSLRSCQRARCLRYRLRCQHQWREIARHHSEGLAGPVNLTHRGACGCDPETGDGAGLLIQIPHKFFAREARRSASPCRAGEYGVGMMFLPVERAAAAALRRHPRAHRPRRRPDRARLARHARSTATPSAAWRAPRSPTSSRSSSARAAGMTQDAVRAQALRRPQARRSRNRQVRHRATRASSTSRRFPRAPSSIKDCCWRRRSPTSTRSLRDPERDQRAVPGAPALLHQHVSHLAAGASVPLHLPQRRDQHRARQRELDARAPVGAGVAALRRRHQEAVPDHPAGRQRFRRAR